MNRKSDKKTKSDVTLVKLVNTFFRQKGMISIFIVGVLAGAFMMFYAPYGLLPVSFYSESLYEKSAFWEDRIKVRGLEVAHDEYKKFARAKGAVLKHRLDHLFGGASYRVLGYEGVVTCDYMNEYGCLHEYFRQAAHESGSGALSELLDVCKGVKEGNGQCIHALGHGIVASYGYQKSDLLKALDACTPLRKEDAIFGCDGGVFMEYNGYYLLDDVLVPRTPEVVGWYEPCDGILEVNRRSCVWWLNRWWSEYMSQSSHYSKKENFLKRGELCNNLPWERFQRECFQAFGQSIAPLSGWNPKKIKEICSDATKTNAQKLYCLSYAAAMFINSDMSAQPAYGTMIAEHVLPTQTKAIEICSDLLGPSKIYCEAYALNKYYIPNELEFPRDVVS